jgi:hypothetical protein
MNKPTPGPWETASFNNEVSGKTDWDVCVAGGGDMICDLQGLENAKANAAFIAAAFNACRSVNPDNPLAVAEGMAELVEAARKAHDFLSGGVVSNYPKSVNHLLEYALRKLEAK